MFGNSSSASSRSNHICGCYYVVTNGKIFDPIRRYLPQVKLASHTTISPLCFTTILTQTFHNPNPEAIAEGRYVFPLYDGVAVNGYTISYADKVLKGVVKQKDDAKQEYKEAIDRGETAGLLESLPDGIFGVTLGNVPAGADIVVEITYCGELKHDAAIDGLRYTLPTSIAPRYGEHPGQVLSSNTQTKGGISITVDINMVSSAVRKVQSPSHPIAVTSGSTSTAASTNTFKPHQSSATLTLGTTELAQDFVLQLLVDDINKPRAVIETHPTLLHQRAIMATLVPNFILEPAHPEIVFIADQSGSMQGTKNTALVKALHVFLKSLPLGVKFNICAFGNNYDYLWPKSQAYNAENLQRAVECVSSFSASYGGTEILRPIKAAFEQRLGDMPLEVMLLTDGEVWGEQSIFSYVNEQIRDKKVDARVFALGIGDGVSHALVEGVARAGKGFAQFVTPEEEATGLDRKVVRMLKGALYAHTWDYELEVVYAKDENLEATPAPATEDDDDFELVEKFNSDLHLDEKTRTSSVTDIVDKPAKSFFDTSLDPSKPEAQGKVDRYAHLPHIDLPALLQAPSELPPLFPFSRTTVYMMLGPGPSQQQVSAIVLRAKSVGGPLELTIPVDELETNNGVATVHQLAARKAIQDLEEGRGWLNTVPISAAKSGAAQTVEAQYGSWYDEIVEREAVRLGERFQVAGKWSSFVAVEAGSKEATRSSETVTARSTDAREASAAGSHLHSTAASLQQRGERLDSLQGNVHIDRAVYSARKQSSSGGVLCRLMSSGPPKTATPAVTASGQTGGLFSGVASAASGLFGSRAPSVSNYQQRHASFAAPSMPGSLVPQPTGYEPSSTSGQFIGGGGLFAARAPPPPPPARQSYGKATSLSQTSSAGTADCFFEPREHTGASEPTSDVLTSLTFKPSDQVGSDPFPGRIFDWVPKNGSPVRAAALCSMEAKRPSEIDPIAAMHTLIGLQTFSGAWLWNDELANVIGVDASVCSDWRTGDSVSSAAKATALALAFLTSRVANQKDVWEMVAKKATTWLMHEMGKKEKEVARVMDEAARRLKVAEGDDW
ncbi:hypothetical protein LTR56_010674 [Elasticomyces elasticus]|nr:hypothetical protein LTR56_010674 [Elasticomyces elasticus]KAK3655393.1 hypothetical protein LTR22_010278 [Elasticomyces elasticus]KAK4922127.1 hypothetical protein LTR49_010538 [Elasticomyces elasticus]KAK5751552.1 hypothetical protein LTS12_018394 [Elasticomyces elasticus]